MARPVEHLSDDELAEFNAGDERDGPRVRSHLRTCQACRRRQDEVIRLRELLALTGHRERRPLRDVVPSAMMRLRLRRHSVANANEFLEGVVALVRGLASLFSVPITEERGDLRTRGKEDEKYG